MDSKENKELKEAFEALLWGSRELRIGVKAGARTLAQKIKKLDDENNVELGKIAQMANNLRQELLMMLEANQSLSLRDESRYFFLPIDKKEKTKLKAKFRRLLDIYVGQFIIILVTSCFVVSSYLLYTNILIPLRNNQEPSVRFYIPLVIVVGTLFAGAYIVQSLRVYFSLVKYRKLSKERTELGEALYSTENSLLKLVEFQTYEKEVKGKDTVENSEASVYQGKALWSQYDSAIVDFLYKKRK